ncbi:hypothetical protein GCM10009093_03420 [Brevundimonas terrae]|uniref:Uncharacterized protein n=1 Tax=Brevundimonas terrae TaxID=363631 RepID=A0ABP3HTF0_9CAUL
MGQIPQPRGRYAIGPALVFLHLLKTDAQTLSKLLLRQAQHTAAAAHPAANMQIDLARQITLACFKTTPEASIYSQLQLAKQGRCRPKRHN